MGKVFSNCPFEIRDARESAASNTSSRDLAEEPFDLIEPTCARWREMQYEARMKCKPALDAWLLVRRVIVENKMDRQVTGNLAINLAEES